MNLEVFTKFLLKQLKEVTPSCHFEINRDKKIVYPYVVFSFDWEKLSPGGTGFYVDIDLFDKSTSHLNLLQLESRLQRFFDGRIELTDDLLVRFGKATGTQMPTNDETIIRRYVRLYCQVDWRNIDG